jgi:hypothetical protein
VAVGSGVLVAVGVGVAVGSGVLVAVGVGVLVGPGVGVGVLVGPGVGVLLGIPIIGIHCDTSHRPIESALMYIAFKGIPTTDIGNEETNTSSYPVNSVQLVHSLSVQAYNFTDVMSSPTTPKSTETTNDDIFFY